MTAEELKETVFVQMPNGDLCALVGGSLILRPVIVGGHVEPHYVKLFAASAIMFNVMRDTKDGLDALLQHFETSKQDHLCAATVNFISAIEICQAIALEGPAAVAARQTGEGQKPTKRVPQSAKKVTPWWNKYVDKPKSSD